MALAVVDLGTLVFDSDALTTRLQFDLPDYISAVKYMWPPVVRTMNIPRAKYL